MTTSTPSLSHERSEWLTQIAQSRAQVLAQVSAGTVESVALRDLADTEMGFAHSLQPVPVDVAARTRATHAYARPYLERLPSHDPAREVVADPTHSYTPRKVLRRVLDHALDHLNQIEQWLLWQQQGIVPQPTDGWADSATTLEEDRLPISSADLKAWLWRMDLVAELIAQRAEHLRSEQLDWVPPDGGWSLWQSLHHLASAEIFYVTWLDEALPEDSVARYEEANRRFTEQVQRVMALPEREDTMVFDAEKIAPTTIGHIVQEALAAEYSLLHNE